MLLQHALKAFRAVHRQRWLKYPDMLQFSSPSSRICAAESRYITAGWKHRNADKLRCMLHVEIKNNQIAAVAVVINTLESTLCHV